MNSRAFSLWVNGLTPVEAEESAVPLALELPLLNLVLKNSTLVSDEA